MDRLSKDLDSNNPNTYWPELSKSLNLLELHFSSFVKRSSSMAIIRILLICSTNIYWIRYLCQLVTMEKEIKLLPLSLVGERERQRRQRTSSARSGKCCDTGRHGGVGQPRLHEKAELVRGGSLEEVIGELCPGVSQRWELDRGKVGWKSGVGWGRWEPIKTRDLTDYATFPEARWLQHGSCWMGQGGSRRAWNVMFNNLIIPFQS